jgi:hypothetical protein
MVRSMKFFSLGLLITVSLFCLTDFALSADPQAPISLVINELMASNAGSVEAGTNLTPDWIELYNAGTRTVNLSGMYLSDDPVNLTQWQFPQGTSIARNDYLVIWADTTLPDTLLHTNFNLSSDGEDLYLVDTDGVTVMDHVLFDEQITDISFGRVVGSGLWRYMLPSPEQANGMGFEGVVESVQFSVEHGFYEESFELTLSCQTDGVKIYYTTDGSDPWTLEAGGNLRMGQLYTDPMTITTTTPVRAVATRQRWKESVAVAQSYIFLDDVIYQPVDPEGFPNRWGSRKADYEMDRDIVNDARFRDNIKTALTSIPTVSIVMDKNHMFGGEGVYSNPQQDIEKPASVELFYPDGSQAGFQVNCGIKIIGGASRNMSLKNSLRLLFKGAYGPAKLKFPLFGADAANEFNTIVLRSSFNDGYGWSGARSYEQYTRDEFIRTLQRDMGHVSPNSFLAHLYINGLYWGIYFPCERPDASFSASYYGGKEEDWDTFSHRSMSLREGNNSALHQMTALCQQASSSNEAYHQLQGNYPNGSRNPDTPCLLDMTSYVDYLILNYCVNNEDWPWNNYWFGRKRTADSTGFKFYSWDSEISLYLPSRAHMNLNRTKDFRDVGKFHGYLIQNSEYRLFFADRVHHHLFNNGTLSPDYVSDLYLDIANQVEMPVIGESARWGDMHHSQPLDQDDWYNMRDWLLANFFHQRHDIVLQQLRNAGLYPEVQAPIFYVNGVYLHGGHVDLPASLTMDSPSGTTYYTVDGTDPRHTLTTSEPNPTTQLVTESAAKKVLIPEGAMSDNWKNTLDFDDSAWISGTGGIGYERSSGYDALIDIDVAAQMYNSNTSCYIRIPFTITANPDSFDFLTLNMQYDDGFIAYINGSEVQRILFTGTPAWNSRADGGHEAQGIESFDLSNYLSALQPGNNILAIHGLNVVTNSSDFIISAALTAGQRSSPINNGVSPVAIEYAGPISLTRSLHINSRVLDDVTWSALNETTFAIGPVAENLRITEIMYHPQETGDPNDPNEEFIELKNIGTEPFNLNLVRFTNGIDFTFPDIDLAPGQVIVIVKNSQVFKNRYGTDIIVAGQYSGSLANNGERIRLEDAVGQTILDFEYSDEWYSMTDGRGYSLIVLNPEQSDPNQFSQKSAWQPSPIPGGTPGF